MKIEFEFSTEGLPQFDENDPAGVSNAVSVLLTGAIDNVLTNRILYVGRKTNDSNEVREAVMASYEADCELLRRMKEGMAINGKKV